tara:strand:- start:11718 stop:11912 length:195 start_codon:yes stop_codon:yes gene_type:complete
MLSRVMSGLIEKCIGPNVGFDPEAWDFKANNLVLSPIRNKGSFSCFIIPLCGQAESFWLSLFVR